MESNFGSTITKTLSFYSEAEHHFKEWYVDLPEFIAEGGTKAQLQMVCGADMLLDLLSEHAPRIKLKVSNVPFKGCNQLDRTDAKSIGEEFSETGGAFYHVDTIKNKYYGESIWLCDVLKYVFEGEFPETIYYAIA